MAYFSAHHRPDKAIGLMQPRESEVVHLSVVLTIGRINDVFIPKHDGTEAPREA